MFTITIQKPTAAEAIAELMTAASFYSANPKLAGPLPEDAKPEAPAKRAKKEEPKADPKPAVSEPASTAAQLSKPTTLPDSASAAKSPSDETVTIDVVRAYLSPFLSDPVRAPLVTALVKDIGGATRLSAVPADKLGALLAAAKEKFDV